MDDAAEILAAVKQRFPHVREPKKQDICYATQNRQDAVKVLAPSVDVVIVVGSPTSSNSNRLRELAERLGTPAYMVDAASDLRAEWFEGRRRVGLTAGASAPDILVQQVIERLRELGAHQRAAPARCARDVDFPLPLGLGDRSMAELDAPAPLARSGRAARAPRPPRSQGPLMLDINLLRRELDRGSPAADAQDAAALSRRGALRTLETERKTLQTRVEELQARRNALSKQIGQLKAKVQDSSEPMAEVARIADGLSEGAARARAHPGRTQRHAAGPAQPAAGQRAGGH